ncbi:MAG: hypothetical protein R3E79_30485 [Caldilineaceae bacterium]
MAPLTISSLEQRQSRRLGAADCPQIRAGGCRRRTLCLVEQILLRPLPADATTQGPLLTLADPQHPDPYSLQVTFVFPQAPPRFQDRDFKSFVERTVRGRRRPI